MDLRKKKKKCRKNRISITAIRDWASFILTVAGIWLSLSSQFYMNMHFHYYIEVVPSNSIMTQIDNEDILKYISFYLQYTA